MKEITTIIKSILTKHRTLIVIAKILWKRKTLGMKTPGKKGTEKGIRLEAVLSVAGSVGCGGGVRSAGSARGGGER